MKPSEPLKNSRHEAFALALSTGKTAAAAYKEAGYKPDNCEGHASRLAGIGTVKARIKWLKAQRAAKVVKLFAWEEVDALNWAKRVIETPIDNVTANHDLAQERTTTVVRVGKTVRTVTRVKMPGKMEALAKIIEMKGWNKGTKAELQAAGAVATLAEKLAAVRSRRYVKGEK